MTGTPRHRPSSNSTGKAHHDASAADDHASSGNTAPTQPALHSGNTTSGHGASDHGMPERDNFSVQAPDVRKIDAETAPISREELEEISSSITVRLNEKFMDYDAYEFSLRESGALNILFDLMQEYQNPQYLSLLPVLLLKNAFDLDAEFYCRTDESEFILRTPAILQDGWTPPKADRLSGDHVIDGQRVCVPVRGRFVSKVQEEHDRKIRGLLVLYPEKPLDRHQLLYFTKFANRLGFSMHNQSLAQRNREHLDFVRNLVKDIGHNVLGPNMYFKLLINKLGAALLDLGQELHNNKSDIHSIMERARAMHLELLDQVNEIQQNFNHSSLFLESLLRESHFTQGRYVLRTTRLHIFERVVKSQFASYSPLFQAKGIDTGITLAPDCNDEVEADFGLISQVVANMFSNALKYASVTPDSPVPFMRCRVLPAAIDGSAEAVRVEVLTSGEHIKKDEAARLFEKYFRASNTGEVSGTGKGLHFVNDIVALHNGIAGYEATAEGNLFHFTLPCALKKKD
ncbi:HAMP domain-containing histidine kinase [Desulfovibrio sp. OttesenSCG-928-C06]|nr:HAMP domain-containing histidine kinase [Desulfovibrio sp. OttesenSCG-928-C06]